jgi:hypothetical protein
VAEDIRVTTPIGPNGERLELKLGNRSFGISAKDIVSVVMLLGLLGGFYLVTQHLSAGQARGFEGLMKIFEQNATHQAQMLDKLHGNQTALIELVSTNRSQMMEEVNAQNKQVGEQTATLQATVDAQTQALRKWFVTLNYNLKRDPSEQIPIEFLPEDLPQRERGR